MKHIKKFAVLAVAVAILALGLLTGCGSSGPIEGAPETINGTTWKVTNYTVSDEDQLGSIVQSTITEIQNGDSSKEITSVVLELVFRDGKATMQTSYKEDGVQKVQQGVSYDYTYDQGNLTMDTGTGVVNDENTMEFKGKSVDMILEREK